MAGRRLANLVEGAVHHACVRRVGLDEPYVACRIAIDTLVEDPARDPPRPADNQSMQVRAVKVSSTAAESADGDLDQLVDGEHRVLHERAVGPRHMGLGQCQRDLGSRSRGHTMARGRPVAK